MSDAENSPFKQLGQRLKTLRQNLQETPADVSGAVEIDEALLERFETGQERPSEEILNLLISHFSVPDDDAASLWHLAGYEMSSHDDNDDQDTDEPVPNNRAGVLVMAIDPRIIYTDAMYVNANPNGVVMSFAQLNGAQQPLITARVGMSREQARSVIKTLQGALDRSEPRQLPAPQASQTHYNQDQPTDHPTSVSESGSQPAPATSNDQTDDSTKSSQE